MRWRNITPNMIADAMKKTDADIIRRPNGFNCIACQTGSPRNSYALRFHDDQKSLVCANCMATVCAQISPVAGVPSATQLRKLLEGSAKERIRGLGACHLHCEKACMWGGFELTALGNDEEIFAATLKCLLFGGKSFESQLVRALALVRICRVFKLLTMTRHFDPMSASSDPLAAMALIEAIPSLGHDAKRQIELLLPFRVCSDKNVRTAADRALAKHGLTSDEDIARRKRLQSHIDLLMTEHRADSLKPFAKFVGDRCPGLFASMRKEDLCIGIACFLDSEEYVRTLLGSFTPRQRMVVDALVWERHALSVEDAGERCGFTIGERKDSRYSYGYGYGTGQVVIDRDLAPLLSTYGEYRGVANVSIHPWLRPGLRRILPKPEGATMRGTDDPPCCDEGTLHVAEPAFTASLPALDALVAQGTLSLKKNGEPTVAGFRILKQCANYDEFCPDDMKLKHTRGRMIYTLLRDAPKAKRARTTGQQALSAWVDGLFNTSKKGRRCKLYLFLEHISGAWEAPQCPNERKCIDTLKRVMENLPQQQWVTIRQINDFILYNALDLPLPQSVHDAYTHLENIYGARGRRSISENPARLWETPLIRNFCLLMGSVGLLDLMLSPPRNDHFRQLGQDYLVSGDGIQAVRLNAVGSWYFHGGDDGCFEEAESGTVVLDSRRLLIQLRGSNPVLRVTLEQTAEALPGGFYRIDGETFLKDCNNRELVERKVEALRSLLPDDLPPVWQQFLDSVLSRINPVELQEDLIVLKLGDSDDLRERIIIDPALRALVLLTEGNRLVVARRDLGKFKRRLKKLGYFVDAF